jgi:hypothetical protein
MQPLDWKVVPRGDIHHSHTRTYVTMNPKGEIVLNGAAWKRVGEPAAFLVMYNPPNSLILLKPTAAAMKDAYPLRKRGPRDGRVVRVLRLLTEFNIKLPDTVEFREPEIDRDCQMTLDLRTARVSPKAHSQCRAKK